MCRAMAICSPFGSKRMHSGKLKSNILGSELSRNVGNKLSIKQRHIQDNNKLNQNAVTIIKTKINIY
jgi:hypothetical protein